MMSRITLLLVDDHVVVRQGLRALLEAETDMEVVGEAENGREAVAAAGRMRPDVVLMDVVMPELNGVEATRQILKEVPSAKVLVLSSYSDEGCVQEMVQAGAVGYLSKRTVAGELSEAIRQVRRGNGYLSATIERGVREQVRRGQSGGVKLTGREVEVLELIAAGRLNKEVAAELGISVKTVEKHRQRVMDKLGIHEIAGLTRYAIARGMV